LLGDRFAEFTLSAANVLAMTTSAPLWESPAYQFFAGLPQGWYNVIVARLVFVLGNAAGILT
jgi:hypothetical protein